MAYEQRDNEIVMFPNDKKQAEKDPDAKGHGKVAGVEYWASGWNNQSKDGKPYRKIALTRKDAAKGGGKPASKPDGEVPW